MATKTGTKKRSSAAKENLSIVEVSRYRAACPSCGYPSASVNTHRGMIHCHSCHVTQAFPLANPDAAVESAADSLAMFFGVELTSRTSMTIPWEGENLVVTVAKAVS